MRKRVPTCSAERVHEQHILSLLGFGITLCDARNEKDLEVLLSAADTSIGQIVVGRSNGRVVRPRDSNPKSVRPDMETK